MAGEKVIASSVGTSTASKSAVAHKGRAPRFFSFLTPIQPCLGSFVEPQAKKDRETVRTKGTAAITLVQQTAMETLGFTAMTSDPEITMADEKATALLEGTSTASESLLESKGENVSEAFSTFQNSQLGAEPVEDKDMATNGVFAKVIAACQFNAGQVASGYEQVEIQMPIDLVFWIVGKDGETFRNICYCSRTCIELIQPNPSDVEQSKYWTFRITGGKEIETARRIVEDIANKANDVMNTDFLIKTVRKPPLCRRFGEEGYILRGPLAPPWGYRGLSHHSKHPPSSQTQPPQSYSHGYNEAKYDNHAPSQHDGPQPSPYAQGGPTTHSGYDPPQDQYGKPPPMYNMQQPQGPPPHAQPYGQQPRPNQTEEAPCQGPAQTYGQHMPPPQQRYPFALSGPVQQTYPNPPYGSAPASVGNLFLPTWFGQQAYTLAGPTVGYGLYPAPVYPAAYGAPPQPSPVAAAHAAAQPTQAHQPGV